MQRGQPAPLYPHVQQAATTAVGSTQYRVRSYVCQVSATSDLGYFLTVAGRLVEGQHHRQQAQDHGSAHQAVSRPPAAHRRQRQPGRSLARARPSFTATQASAPSGITVPGGDRAASLFNGIDVVEARGQAARPFRPHAERADRLLTVGRHDVQRRTHARRASDTRRRAVRHASAADTDPASGTGTAPAPPLGLATRAPRRCRQSGSSVANFAVVAPGQGPDQHSPPPRPSAPRRVPTTRQSSLVTGQACSTGYLDPIGHLPGDDGHQPARSATSAASTWRRSPRRPLPTAWRAYGARAILPVSGHCAATSRYRLRRQRRTPQPWRRLTAGYPADTGVRRHAARRVQLRWPS